MLISFPALFVDTLVEVTAKDSNLDDCSKKKKKVCLCLTVKLYTKYYLSKRKYHKYGQMHVIFWLWHYIILNIKSFSLVLNFISRYFYQQICHLLSKMIQMNKKSRNMFYSFYLYTGIIILLIIITFSVSVSIN